MKNYLVILLFTIISTLLTSHGCIDSNINFTHNLDWNYEFDDYGLIKRITDPGGKSTEYSYEYFSDHNNFIRKIEKNTTDEKVTYHFNDDGSLIKMSDNFGIEEYQYNDLGLLKNVQRNNSSSISYTYNTSGKITSLSLNENYHIEYIYDFLGRLNYMKTPAGEISYSYFTGDGIVERQLPNGIKTQYKYFPDSKLESITHIGKDNYIITKYSYNYEPDGLISSIVEWTKNGEFNLTYEYDEGQRLKTFIDRDGTMLEYRYDVFGNRTEVFKNGETIEIYTLDGLGRMIFSNGKPCEYDESGNLVSNKEEQNQYGYNGANLLKKANDVSFEYNGNGLIISRSARNQKNNFINNPLSEIWQPLSVVSDNNKEMFYIWEGDNPVAIVGNGKTTFLLTDHLSSVRGMTDQNGNLTQQKNYSPFGIPDNTDSENSFIPGFTGLFYEPESKLYLAKSRAYSPNTGRFLQIDPLHQVPMGSQKDFSVFAYCGGDPVNYIDRIGLQSKPFNKIGNWYKDFSKIDWWKDFNKSLWDNVNDSRKNLIDNINIKDDWNYFWNTPTNDNTINEIMDNALKLNTNTDGFVDTEQAHNDIMSWRENPQKYQFLFPEANTPNSSEFQVAENTMFAKSTGWTGLLSPGWGSWHYSGERQERSPREMTFGLLQDDRWERQTWKSVVNPYKESLKWIYISNPRDVFKRVAEFLGRPQEMIKRIDDFIARPTYGDEIFGAPGLKSSTVDDGLNKSNSKSPSNVGGVSLSGVGKTFEGLGQLSGIALDENGKLILISEDKGQIDLPPLRLDDVVTVFKSVYQYGEAPYVSIDPDPQDPRGPTMNSRHGEATKNTYVGWILFEADRIMKTFSLGEDNDTKKPVQTNIAGYRDVIEKMFSINNSEQTWERFWIVPAKVERNNSTNKDLTLFEIPLMVNTQRMILRNGKLEPSPDSNISEGAQRFAEWFTSNYERLSQESYSKPPDGSGFDKSVPVFKELQRLALITAIAEQLRDQGVMFPFWMRNYEVKTFPTPETTPAHTVVRNNGNSILSVYGGVNLSPPDGDGSDEGHNSHGHAHGHHESDTLKKEISDTINNLPFLKTLTVNSNNKNYNISTIPGAETKDLSPCVLNEIDLSVKINGDNYLSLTRKYNSFISPLDSLFGKSWSLDLPFLEKQKVPVKRNGDAVEFTYSYHIISPLNSFSKKIDELYTSDNKKIGFKTKLIIQNNANLHFNDDGYLVAYENKPVTVLYNRDNKNRIFQMAGIFGDLVLADIKLEYDDNNRIISASGSNGESVTYEYSADGTLLNVKTREDVLSYEYQNHLVTDIKLNSEFLKQFKYNSQGQLISDNNSGEFEATNTFEPIQNGYRITKSVNSVNGREEKFGHKDIIQYDYSYRPVKQIFEDGSVISADYTNEAETKIEVSDLSGSKLIILKSSEDKNISYSLPNGTNYREEYNDKGELISFHRNNQPIFEQKWNPDGTLSSTAYETSSMHFEYNTDGVLTKSLLTPPGNQDSWNEWKSYEYDNLGRLSEIKDYSGLKILYKYDNSGEISFITSDRENIQILNSDGNIQSIESSNGSKINYSYDDNKIVNDINYSIGGNNSNIKFHDGLLSNVILFNGTEYSYSYNTEKNKGNFINKIKTPVNEIDYEYADNGRLISILCNNNYRILYTYNENGDILQIKISSN